MVGDWLEIDGDWLEIGWLDWLEIGGLDWLVRLVG
jgi:hypothetical protein